MLNFRDSHLKRTSAHIQITRSRGQTAFGRVILGEVSVTNGSDVMEQRPAWGGSLRPPLSCSQAYLQETKKWEKKKVSEMSVSIIKPRPLRNP